MVAAVENKSESDLLYEGVCALNYESEISYQDLSSLLGREFFDNRAPIYSVIKRLLKEKKRYLKNVPGFGYRVIRADEHEGAARDEHVKARRRLGRCISILANTDRNDLETPEERQRIDNLEQVARNQASAIRRLELKAERHERAIKAHEEKLKGLHQKSDETHENTSELQKRVMRLEELLQAQQERNGS